MIHVSQVVNGTFSLQKEWMLSNHLEYDPQVRIDQLPFHPPSPLLPPY